MTMIYALVVPGAIEDVSEVRVLEWHGTPGHAFAAGDLVVELETHKAVVEVRAGSSAVLRQILCESGAWQAIGAQLALLSDSEDEVVPDAVDGLPESAVTFEVV
jgi:pyruvate/2-oxoglutarate dehydrogenase complex dihydrolipoamide acyltransferase (E2) component